MTWVILVRHGITEWNELGLIQGHTDIPLSASGVAKLQQLQLCDDFLRARWVTSPLQRAMQTAAILAPRATVATHPDLIETNWGKFEGARRDELPRRIRKLALLPDHGLDFCPPNGESARMVRRRLVRWFETVADADAGVVAVTHKGVIRSALSAACDWDMADEFSPKADWSLPHLFEFDRDRGLQLLRLNCRWDQSPTTGN